MLWSVVVALAERQHGLISRAQVLELGGTDGWLQRAVRSGRLKRVRHGVYVVAGSVSDYQPLMAVCLAGGPSAAVSHLAAAGLWGAEQVLPGRLELTTFDNRGHEISGVDDVHRSCLDRSRAVTTYHGLPIVVPPLAAVQVAQTWDARLARSVANDLVKLRRTTFADILQWMNLIGDRRQHGLRELCLQAIEVGGHYDSPPARALCLSLMRAGVEPFERDYQVNTPDGVLRIDIAWPAPRLGLEYNGARDHGSRLARIEDERRRFRLGALGWRILDVSRGMTHEEVIGWVRAALAVRPATG